eukprot:6055197-Amphidinium_carterae.1
MQSVGWTCHDSGSLANYHQVRQPWLATSTSRKQRHHYGRRSGPLSTQNHWSSLHHHRAANMLTHHPGMKIKAYGITKLALIINALTIIPTVYTSYSSQGSPLTGLLWRIPAV